MRDSPQPASGCEDGRLDAKRYLLRELPADLAWCLAIAVLLTLLVTPFVSTGRIPLEHWIWGLLQNFLITACIGLSVANLYRFVYPRLVKRFATRLAKMALHLLLIGAGVGVGVEISVRILQALFGAIPTGFRGSAIQIGLVIAGLVVALSITYEQLRDRARRDELRAEQARQEALRARLEALQARTHPHFLFNSLNTAAGLIEEDPTAAERVLERLAGLFRYSLEGSSKEWVRLAEELEAVRTYLDVETIRLGERLRIDFQVASEVENVLVPPLVLQPLVENAILHGIAPRKGGGAVVVRAARNGSRLELAVLDDGPGPGNSRHRGTGSALADLENRLRLIYGDRAALNLGEGPSGGYQVTLSLPFGGRA